MRNRSGMILVATIAIVSLIAILAVATLALSGRVEQTSTLTLREASLASAAAYGVASVAQEWRSRSIGQMSVGTTREFEVTMPAIPATVRAAVTRISAEVFW